MAIVMAATTPQEARDEIVRWLEYKARLGWNEKGELLPGLTKSYVEQLARELAGILCIGEV